MSDDITWNAEGREARIAGVPLVGRKVLRFNSGNPRFWTYVETDDGDTLDSMGTYGRDEERIARWVVEGALRECAERLRKAGKL